jgi:hypothetical protein
LLPNCPVNDDGRFCILHGVERQDYPRSRREMGQKELEEVGLALVRTALLSLCGEVEGVVGTTFEEEENCRIK